MAAALLSPGCILQTLCDQRWAWPPCPQRDPREWLSGSTPGYSGVVPSSILQDPCALAPFTLLPNADPQRPAHLASLFSSTSPPPFSLRFFSPSLAVKDTYLFLMTPEPVTQTLYYLGFLSLLLLIMQGNKERKTQLAQMGSDHHSRSELSDIVPLATCGYRAFEMWPV